MNKITHTYRGVGTAMKRIYRQKTIMCKRLQKQTVSEPYHCVNIQQESPVTVNKHGNIYDAKKLKYLLFSQPKKNEIAEFDKNLSKEELKHSIKIN